MRSSRVGSCSSEFWQLVLSHGINFPSMNILLINRKGRTAYAAIMLLKFMGIFLSCFKHAVAMKIPNGFANLFCWVLKSGITLASPQYVPIGKFSIDLAIGLVVVKTTQVSVATQAMMPYCQSRRITLWEHMTTLSCGRCQPKSKRDVIIRIL